MGSGNSRNGRVAVSPVGPRPNGIGPAVKDNFIFDRQSRSGRTRLHNPAGQISDTRPPLNASGNFVRTEPMAPRPVVSVVTGNQAEVVRPKETKLAKRAETAKVPREKQSVEEKIVGSPDDLRLLASAVDDFRRCQKAVESDQLMTSASLPYLEQLDVLNGVPRDSRLWEIWISRLNSAGLVPTWMDWWNAAWANGVPLSDGDNSAASRRNFVFVLRLMWSAAATSPAVCDQLVKLGGLAAIVEKMGSQTGFQTESLARYRQRRYFAAGLMGVTLSCLRLSRSAPDNFRSVSGPSALQQLTSSPYEAIRLRSQLCLTAAGDMSAVTEATVRRALELLSSAWDRPGRVATVGGLTAAELLDFLNRLANTDELQTVLIRAGLLRLYGSLLDGVAADSDDPDVNRLLQGIWAMSFLPEGKAEIRRDQKCLDALQRLRANRSRRIARGASGSLWTIAIAAVKFKKTPETEDVETEGLTGRHIFISYEWGSEAAALVVRKSLNRGGFATWLDTEKPEGSPLDIKASAVESAAFVVLLVTEAYRNSPACRAEAEYSYVRHKRVVGLLAQKDFRPDGWLGAIVAGPNGLLDFWSETDITATPARLIELLKRLGVKTTEKTRWETGRLEE